jgi:DNA-binding response OmpR family regulator
MKKILVVDDDAMLLNSLKMTLHPDYLVLTACSGKEALTLAPQELPDLILLDLHLPTQNGFEVFRSLREQPKTSVIPVIMLTGDTDPENLVTGLNLGAIDYLRKPFHARELLARIQARLRAPEQNTTSAQTMRTLGNLTINYEAHSVSIDGQPIPLTEFELQLLTYLIDHAGKVIHRQKLLSVLWPDSVVSPRTVDTHVAHLRKKLKGFDHEIKTIHRAGYRVGKFEATSTELSLEATAETDTKEHPTSI